MFRHNDFVQRLLDKEVVTDSQLKQALELRRTTMKGCDLLTILVDQGHVTLRDLCEDLARRFDIEHVTLSEITPPPDLIALISPRIARFYRVVPYREEDGALLVASDDPTNLSIFESLKKLLQRVIIPAVATPDEITAALQKYYPEPKA